MPVCTIALGDSYIACSGAGTWHITGQNPDGTTAKPHQPNSPDDVYGRRPLWRWRLLS